MGKFEACSKTAMTLHNENKDQRSRLEAGKTFFAVFGDILRHSRYAPLRANINLDDQRRETQFSRN